MSSRECPFEESVMTAASSGQWSPELETHRNSCLSCAELTLVVAALRDDAADLVELETPLPDPSAIWMRARLASRERDFRRATSGIAWVQRTTVAVAVAIGLAFAPWLWRLVTGALSGVDLTLPAAQLPRAAGSPLAVVIGSLVILGALAFWELTAVRES